jgi:hypothetical protein
MNKQNTRLATNKVLLSDKFSAERSVIQSRCKTTLETFQVESVTSALAEKLPFGFALLCCLELDAIAHF